jgi:RNA polymerase sigma-70 factor (ECF subfamily)
MKEYGKELTDEDSVSFDERSVQRQVIEDALAKLKERDRIIIILRDVQGYSYEEMSQILECPLGTVRSRLSRARKSMVKILNEMELKNSYMRQNR